MATSMSEFAKASDFFGINKFEEFQVDVLNKIFELLMTPVKWHWNEIVTFRRWTWTQDPRYTGPLLYQMS